MQFTTLAALLATVAMTATAAPAPASDLEARQGAPRVRATFYYDSRCGQDGRPYADDYVFLQSAVTGLAGCQDLPASSTFENANSVYFNETSVTRTIRFYNLPCAQLTDVGSGGHIDVAPGSGAGCNAFKVRSYVTL